MIGENIKIEDIVTVEQLKIWLTELQGKPISLGRIQIVVDQPEITEEFNYRDIYSIVEGTINISIGYHIKTLIED
jgi:DNA gyrase inhibitor GyrI